MGSRRGCCAGHLAPVLATAHPGDSWNLSVLTTSKVRLSAMLLYCSSITRVSVWPLEFLFISASVVWFCFVVFV